eukprot:53094-Rhodomonas_salina.1
MQLVVVAQKVVCFKLPPHLQQRNEHAVPPRRLVSQRGREMLVGHWQADSEDVAIEVRVPDGDSDDDKRCCRVMQSHGNRAHEDVDALPEGDGRQRVHGAEET